MFLSKFHSELAVFFLWGGNLELRGNSWGIFPAAVVFDHFDPIFHLSISAKKQQIARRPNPTVVFSNANVGKTRTGGPTIKHNVSLERQYFGCYFNWVVFLAPLMVKVC